MIGQKQSLLKDLGVPKGPERTLSDGVTTYQSYANCAIFSSPAYGTFSVPATVDAQWQRCDNLTTSNDESVQDYLGAPVQDPVDLPGGGAAVYFERGMITVRPDKRAFVTYGAIFLRYRSFGDITSFLGLPMSDEESIGTGRRSRFDAGEICWRADSGAFETHGAIHDRFEALGGAVGFGFPTTNETQVFQNGKEIGRYNNFENGRSIYWSPATGAWDVCGAIKGKWDEYVGPTGPLGFPVSGETDTPLAHSLGNDANGRYNNFQNGIIVWHPAGPYRGAWPVFNLHFYVDGFTSNFDPFQVQAKVHSSYGQGFDNWIPSPKDYSSNPRVEKDLITIVPIVHSDLTLDAWFDGLGYHLIGDNERLGIYHAIYNISNLWGMLDAPDHAANQNQNSSFSFNCKFRLMTDPPPTPNTPWRRQYWWPFHNFSTAQLSWSEYSQTFTDVHDDESVFWHPFDHLFYSLAYEGAASHGTCFGMCLESIYAQYHRSLYSEPVFSNPFNKFPAGLLGGGSPSASDDTLTNGITIRHGYQLGAEVINYFLGKFASGHTHDPIKCFEESFASFQAGDLPLISISKDYFFGGAHCLRPYEWNRQSNPWTIKVANPNTPASTCADDNAAANVIKIDPVANTFAVDAAPGNTYQGGESSGGRMFSIPYSVMSSPPCTPIWETLALLAAGTLIIVGDDGQTKQIKDESGHTYLTPGGTINEDANTRIPNFAPVPLLNSVAAHELGMRLAEPLIANLPQIYYMQRPAVIPKKTTRVPAQGPTPAASHPVRSAVTLDLRRQPAKAGVGVSQGALREVVTPSIHHEVITPNGRSYRWGMRTAAMSVVVQAPGSPGGRSDVITIASPGRPTQAVTISVARGGNPKTVSVQVVGPTMSGAANSRLFEIANLPLAVEQGITLSLDNGGEDLLLHNHGPQVSIALRIQSGTQAANSASRPSVMLEAGMVHRITPSDWTPAKVATAPIGLQVMDRIGGAVVKQTRI